jgi:hypothetical protein
MAGARAGAGRVGPVLTVLAVVVASWVSGAHFLRFGAFELVTLFLFLPALLLVRRSWAVRVIQAGLLVSTLMWLRTTWSIVGDRQAAGEEWGRVVLILGGVAAFTLVAALLLESPRFRARYGLRTSEIFR